MPYNSRLAELLHRALRLRLQRTSMFQEMLKRAVSQSPLNVGLDMLEEFIALFEVKESRFSVPIPLTPPSTDISGPLQIGYTVPHLVRVGIDEAELTRIMLVLGRVGSGKTSLASLLIYQLPRGQGAFVFDRFGDFEWLAGKRGDIIYLPYKYFLHSLFQAPPGCDEEKFIHRAGETMGTETGLFLGSESIYTREVIGLLRRGIESEGPGFVPTLGQVIEHLYHIRVEPQERQYIVRIRSRLESLYLSLGNTLNARTSCLPHLLNKIVIVNMQGMDVGDIFVFVSQVLVWLESYFETLGTPSHPLRYTVVIDEAHHILSSRHSNLSAGETSFVSRILDCRGRGLGLILMSQDGMALNQTARSQAATRIYFALGSPQDAHEAATYLWGSEGDADLERSLLNLPRGYCYVKHPRNPEAHLLKIPYVDPRRHPHDLRQVLLRSAAYLHHAGFQPQPGHTPERWQQAQTEEDATPDAASASGERVHSSTTAQAPHGPTLSQDADRFVRQLALKPFSTVKEVREMLELGGSTYDRIRRQLLGHPELIQFVQLATGKRGSAPQWARLTPAGFAYAGVQPPPELDHDSNQALHTFWKHRVHACLRAGGKYAQLYIDREIGDKKKIDVAGVTATGELHAFEIELQPELRHLLRNIELDLEVRAARVVVLVPDKETITKAQRMITESFASKEQPAKIVVEALGSYLGSS